MRPIPAPRLGDAHGLLRAIQQRERVRLDEFVTEFSVEELFPPTLENALGRTRQFISFARAAGLVNEDRGTVELTDMGKRYVRAGDAEKPFEISPGQAEWLRRLLRERHMTDSIYHGAAIGLSLFASNPPGFQPSRLDFGRAVSYLGRAGWDNENTFQSQGERYTTFLRDLELLDAENLLTATGRQTREELTLPIHMSLRDLCGQLNPGGIEAAEREGRAEREAAAPPEPEPAPPAAAEPSAPVEAAPAPPAAAASHDDDDYEDVGPGAGPSPAAAPGPLETAGGPPVPPAGLWESAAPEDRTKAYGAIRPDAPAPAASSGAPAGSAAPPASAPPAPRAARERRRRLRRSRAAARGRARRPRARRRRRVAPPPPAAPPAPGAPPPPPVRQLPSQPPPSRIATPPPADPVLPRGGGRRHADDLHRAEAAGARRVRVQRRDPRGRRGDGPAPTRRRLCRAGRGPGRRPARRDRGSAGRGEDHARARRGQGRRAGRQDERGVAGDRGPALDRPRHARARGR